MSGFFFLEGAGVLALAFVLWKRGTFGNLRKNSKLEEKAAPVGRGHVWYTQGGPKKGPTCVLLHGFAADKSQWEEVATLLIAAGYTVVVPDLPGFGANLRDIDGKYDATSLAKQLRTFVRATDLGAFNLVGHGIGAIVAASYAYGMPADLASLTLVEPLGLTVPAESDFEKVMKNGRNPLLPSTPAAYDHLLGFVTATPPKLQPVVKKKRAETLAGSRDFYQRVWSELREGDRAHLMDLLLPEIKVRTLMLFGTASRVVHPSTAKVWEKRLEGHNVRVTLVPGAGHWVMVDKPKEVADLLVGFFKAPAEERKAKRAEAAAERAAERAGERGAEPAPQPSGQTPTA